MDGKEAIAQYKEWYQEFYGIKPTEKLIDTFCRMKGIDREEVTKVEENKMKHSELPWKIDKVNDLWILSSEESEYVERGYFPVAQPIEESDAEFIVEACNNYEALETNYHNLLAEFQEVSAIAQEQKQTIEDGNALIVKLSINMGKLLNILDYYKDLLSPSDIGKVEEIKKEVKL